MASPSPPPFRKLLTMLGMLACYPSCAVSGSGVLPLVTEEQLSPAESGASCELAFDLETALLSHDGNRVTKFRSGARASQPNWIERSMATYPPAMQAVQDRFLATLASCDWIRVVSRPNGDADKGMHLAIHVSLAYPDRSAWSAVHTLSLGIVPYWATTRVRVRADSRIKGEAARVYCMEDSLRVWSWTPVSWLAYPFMSREAGLEGLLDNLYRTLLLQLQNDDVLVCEVAR